MEEEQLVYRDDIVTQLRTAIISGEALLNVPGLVKRLFINGAWEDRVIRISGEHVSYDDFRKFVEDPPTQGLGIVPAEKLLDLCKGDKEATRKIRKLLIKPLGKHGGDRKSKEYRENQVDNINLISESGGTDADYRYARALRDAPEIVEKLDTGELSPNAAAKLLGFTHRMVQLPIDDMEALSSALRKHLTDEQIAELKGLL